MTDSSLISAIRRRFLTDSELAAITPRQQELLHAWAISKLLKAVPITYEKPKPEPLPADTSWMWR